MRSHTCFIAGAALWSALVAMPTFAVAQPEVDKSPQSFDQQILPAIQRHCYQCHNSEDASGDVDLTPDQNPRLLLSHRKTWAKVLDVIRSGEMPPEDARRKLNEDKRRDIVEYLERTLSEIDCDSLRQPGTPLTRRLTRTQFHHAMGDLTRLDIDAADTLPPDPIAYGFAGVGSSMGLSPVFVEQTESIARDVAAQLLATRQTNPDVFRFNFGGIEDATGEDQRESIARESLRSFARRGFRRAVDDADVDAFMNVYRVALSSKADSELDETARAAWAISQAMRAVMMSPRFFLRIETNDLDATEAYLVDDFDLASRLSFFLWASPPDDELLELAEAGRLRDETVVAQQTRRMLRDDKVRRGLVVDFFGQWLQLNELDQHQVDAEIFPDFDDDLRTAMRAEVDAVLADMIQNDLPVTTVLDADFTYLNERLARHYDLPLPRDDAPDRVSGGLATDATSLVRVNLTDRMRGGILTSAAYLTLHADPGRTNVPKRGNHIAGTFLGDPPPPPPPDVPTLDETVHDGPPKPLRERLEEHRRNPACASCHAKMDPLGFALEPFDAIGRFRTHDAGFLIDASGQLPSGESFDGPTQLKDVLLANKPKLIRNLTEKLIVYALGRGLQPVDECVVRDAVAASAAEGDSFAKIIETITTSFPFRHRYSPL